VDADSRSRRAELLDAMRLAVVPFGVAILFGLLLLPRRGVPDDVPLPIPDAAALARAIEGDRDLAARARSEPLPAPVRALGSALRTYHSLEVGQNAAQLARARDEVDNTLIEALSSGGDDALLRLRAVELEAFLGELRRFEATGAESDELAALAGPFVRSMKTAGWCDGHTLVPTEPARRTLFKQMWDAFLGLEGRPGFDPTLDEQRALYALYLSAPHPSPAMRAALDAARRGAERGATEEWRLERIRRLAEIDPTYPAAFARGVASYRRADYRGASAAFETWLASHPEGPLSLRARAFLHAADAETAE
jgi:hypothetical protein